MKHSARIAVAAFAGLAALAQPVQADSNAYTNEANFSWALKSIDAQAAWNYVQSQGLKPGGVGSTIAILDQGLDHTHPEFGRRVLNRNPVTGNHGNYVAGIAAAEQNGMGMIGIAPYANLFGADPRVPEELRTLDKLRVDVFSMSFGTSCKKSAEDLKPRIQYLFNGHPDAVFVTSGGQDGGGKTHGWPAGWAAEPWVGGRMIVVGALDRDENNQLVQGSYACNYLTQHLMNHCVFAPGDEDVYGAMSLAEQKKNQAALDAAAKAKAEGKIEKEEPFCVTDANGNEVSNKKLMPSPIEADLVKPIAGPNGTFYLTGGGGTSAATPVVAGIVATVRSVNPNLKAKEVVDVVLKSSRIYYLDSDSQAQPSDTFGWGLADLNKAVREAIKRRNGQ